MIFDNLNNYFESGIFEPPFIQEAGTQLYYGGGTIIDCINGYFGQAMWQFPFIGKETIIIVEGPLFGRITDLSSLKGQAIELSSLKGIIKWINS